MATGPIPANLTYWVFLIITALVPVGLDTLRLNVVAASGELQLHPNGDEIENVAALLLAPGPVVTTRFAVPVDADAGIWTFAAVAPRQHGKRERARLDTARPLAGSEGSSRDRKSRSGRCLHRSGNDVREHSKCDSVARRADGYDMFPLVADDGTVTAI